MPLKTCPNCQNKCGVRTLKCKECDHDFQRTTTTTTQTKPSTTATTPQKRRTTKRFREMCGIGAWIKDTPKGMPAVSEPEPLSELPAKLPVEDISHYIAYEGIGSCIVELIPAKRIQDPKLAAMWEDAHTRIVEIIDYVARGEIGAAANTKGD